MFPASNTVSTSNGFGESIVEGRAPARNGASVEIYVCVYVGRPNGFTLDACTHCHHQPSHDPSQLGDISAFHIGIALLLTVGKMPRVW